MDVFGRICGGNFDMFVLEWYVGVDGVYGELELFEIYGLLSGVVGFWFFLNLNFDD